MKREDAGLVGVVFIFVIIAVVLNSLGVLVDSAFAVASLVSHRGGDGTVRLLVRPLRTVALPPAPYRMTLFRFET